MTSIDSRHSDGTMNGVMRVYVARYALCLLQDNGDDKTFLEIGQVGLKSWHNYFSSRVHESNVCFV